MRDLLIFGFVFGLLPLGFKRPTVALFLCILISLMNPHRLTFGSAFDFPFVVVTLAVALMGLVLTKQSKSIPMKPATAVLLTFIVWMILSTLFAKEPDLAWFEFNRVMKTMFLTIVIIMTVRDVKDVKGLAWVLALSLGFYGFKGGLFTILNGGTNRVNGPPGTYIGDNNALALALVTSIPIIWYFQTYASNLLLRRAMTLLGLLTVISVVGSYSRGAMLGLVAMLFFLWLKSRHKIRTGLAVLLVIPIIYSMMPEKWFQRMDTINEYKQDESAMGRINSWQFAFNIAKAYPTGGGYRVFTPNMFQSFAPNPQVFFDAHSIYFQTMGEHGFIGLGLFLTLMAVAWRTGTRIKKKTRHQPELKWANDLAGMCQVSIIGYATAGAFLTLAYYDLYYFIIALLVTLERSLDLMKTSPVSPKLTESTMNGKTLRHRAA